MVILSALTENHLQENIEVVENGPDEEWRTTTDQQQPPNILYIFCQLYQNN